MKNGNGKNGNGGRAAHGEPPRPRRCAVYCRKSTVHNLGLDFNSLDAQRETCLAYIQSRAGDGWTPIAPGYEDGGYSGATTERPAFRRLVADIEAGLLEVVVVQRIDRLARSLADFVAMTALLERENVAFVSVSQAFDTSTAMGKLTMNILASFAEFESLMGRERTRDKIRAARSKGRWTGGSLPLGYRSQGGKLIVDETTAGPVRECFTIYEQERSALDTARKLNELGRLPGHKPGSRGKPRWNKDAVLRVLRNPVVAGRIRCGDEVVDAEHEPIVAPETFDRVQHLLDGQPHGDGLRSLNPEFILAGLARCGCCGGGMVTTSSRKTSGKTYRYYRCATRDKSGPEACPSRPLSAEALESFVLDRLTEHAAQLAMSDDIDRRFHDRADEEKARLHAERQSLPALVATRSMEVRRLGESLTTLSGSAAAAIERRLQGAALDLANLQGRRTEIERKLALLDDQEKRREWLTNALKDFAAIWGSLTPRNRQRLVAALVERVTVDEPAGKVEITLADLDTGNNGDRP